ncbi:MAG: ABC transporter permease, partial [Pseudorhodoplanes sp.]
MRRYAIRRIIQTVPVVAIVSVVVFAVIRLVPGDPAISMAGADATPETIAAIRESLGLDRPVWAQYLAWLGDVLRGQFGSSLLSNQPVLALILPSAQATLYLTAFAMAVALALGILFGMLAGVFHGRLGDRIISGFSMLSVSMPPYWVGLLLVLAFSVKLGWFPSAGNQAWGSLVLPATALILGQSAMLTRLVRSSIINILAQDYIRT